MVINRVLEFLCMGASAGCDCSMCWYIWLIILCLIFRCTEGFVPTKLCNGLNFNLYLVTRKFKNVNILQSLGFQFTVTSSALLYMAVTVKITIIFLTCYLPTLSRKLQNELERIWKELVVAYSRYYYSIICLVGPRPTNTT
jgi:hypothetical protein